VFLASAACSTPQVDEVTSDTVVSVHATAATVGDIRGFVRATGVVTPAPGAELVVVAPEAARIAEIPRAAGDRVRRGDVLVRFEVPTAVADLQRQQAEVVRARSTLDNAKSAQARAADLFERGVAARREVEDGQRITADAEAALAGAKAALASAESVAGRATVRATFDGVVARRFHNPGDLVEASAGDPVLRVIDPRRLEIVAAVPLADASRVRVGAAGHVSAGPIETTGLVVKVLADPAAVDVGTATIPVRLSLTGPRSLPAGTPVQVDLEAERRAGVVLVPIAAIVREGEETAVFVASDGKAQRRPVHAGLTDGAQIEIVSGLKAGELVIVDGQAGLPDGAAVALVSNSGKAEGASPGESGARDGGK
jgi:RND family efflux transporter MFP subunit